MPRGCAVTALVETPRRPLAAKPSRISCVSRLAAVSAKSSVGASTGSVPSRSDGSMPRSSAIAAIWLAAPCTSATRIFSERRTAKSSRRFEKFSSLTIAPSTLTTKILSRNFGIYWRIPLRSVGFTLLLARLAKRPAPATDKKSDSPPVQPISAAQRAPPPRPAWPPA